MPASFHPRLVNGPYDDPGLFIPFAFDRRAFLFDLGDLGNLSSRDLMKISHGFVTHTHMDHLIGFDALLRVLLGRPKTLSLYGPSGFLANVEGKLSGYTWNLVENYTDTLAIEAVEVHDDRRLYRHYRCEDRFEAVGEVQEKEFNGLLLAEPAVTVRAVILEHQIPCLALSLEERFHVNILKNKLEELGLQVGPWLRSFKSGLYDHAGATMDTIAVPHESGGERNFRMDELTSEIALISPGQKIVYVTDTVYSQANVHKILELADAADHLFIEAVFLEKDRETAAKKFHLTARQAGEIAGRAGAKRFTLFHFSPRYTGQAHLFEKEARDAYEKAGGKVAG